MGIIDGVLIVVGAVVLIWGFYSVGKRDGKKMERMEILNLLRSRADVTDGTIQAIEIRGLEDSL